jgi:hypothetical protein
MDRAQLISRLEAGWRRLEAACEGLPDAVIDEPGVTGDWSVRDVLGHIATWEEEALKHLPSVLAGRRPPRYSVTYGGIDAFNATRREQLRGLSSEDLQRRRRETHSRLLDFLAGVPEEYFQREGRFRRRLRLDTYAHYALHAQAIKTWRTKRFPGP